MTSSEIINLATAFLINNEIPYVELGQLGRFEGAKQEVVFLDPLVLEPNVAVVEPGDIRVWVDTETQEVTLIYQM